LRRSRAGRSGESFAHGHGMGKVFPIPVKTQTDSPSYRNRHVPFVEAKVPISDLTRDPGHCQMIILGGCTTFTSYRCLIAAEASCWLHALLAVQTSEEQE
jgi:hypothetical protein